MAIIVFEHHPLETPARLGDALRDHGHRLKVIELYENDPVPPDLDDVDGVVSMGGPMNVDQTDVYEWIEPEKTFIKQAHDAGLPVVGVCLGAQLIAEALGGEVGKMQQPEIGWHEITEGFPGKMDICLAGIPWTSPQFHMHGCEVATPPADAQVLASSQACKVQAFRVGLTTYAFQYHFEWRREQIMKVLDDSGNVDWMESHNIAPDQVKAETDGYYPLYRELGDRLSKRLTDLIFPISSRLDHKGGTLTSYDPAVS